MRTRLTLRSHMFQMWFPLGQTIPIGKLLAAFPRWILQARSNFAWLLARTFSPQCRGIASASVVYPLPLTDFELFLRSGPKLSKRAWSSLVTIRLLSQEREPTSTACPSPTTLTSSLAPRTNAYDELLRLQHDRKRKRTRREEVGDLYGKTNTPIGSPWPARVYPAFKSLFQQHHLGVEYALSAHSSLLEGYGLLDAPSTRTSLARVGH